MLHLLTLQPYQKVGNRASETDFCPQKFSSIYAPNFCPVQILNRDFSSHTVYSTLKKNISKNLSDDITLKVRGEPRVRGALVGRGGAVGPAHTRARLFVNTARRCARAQLPAPATPRPSPLSLRSYTGRIYLPEPSARGMLSRIPELTSNQTRPSRTL